MTDTAAAEWVDPATLKPWPKNPRKNDGEPVVKVAESIKRFGFAAPIVARLETREIIAGHTRWKAARQLKLDRVPVRFVDLTEREAHALALADNRLGELAEWDTPELHALLAEYDKADQAMLGWDESDMRKLEKLCALGMVELAEDEIPDPPRVAVTQLGDVWRLGPHVLVCADAREQATMQRLLGERRVQVAITSPPYASQRKYDDTTAFQPVKPEEYVEWFEPVQARVREVLSENGSWFLNIKPHVEQRQRSLYVYDLVTAHVRDWGWRLVDELCWTHSGFPGRVTERFKNAWEPIYHFALGYPVKCRPEQVAHESNRVMQYDAETVQSLDKAGWQGAGREPERESGKAYPSNVLRLTAGAGTNAERHPARFPVGLPSFLIQGYTDSGDAVLDPFMGCGTTLIAAEQLQRIAFGVEISPAYCDVIVERWQQVTGNKAQRQTS
jgi:DNA modification methylase